MRLTAKVLATILALLVISEVRPTVSGMAALPPCELAPQVPTTPATQKPNAPRNLRIIPGIDELFEDLFSSGPNAGSDHDSSESFTATAGVAADPHAYYFALASRSDCFAAYSLRNDAQVLQHSTYLGPRDLAYVYPNDPDPRKQDAMRMLTRADQNAPSEGLKLPTGAHHPKNLFTVEERWWGAEMNYHNHKVAYYKGDPYFDSGPTAWIAVRTVWQQAQQNLDTLPPGGPYVLMLNPQFIVGSQYKYPYPLPLRLPSNVASTKQRSYGQEAAGPRDTEFGVVAERWTRIWHFFERAPEEDWSSTSTPAGPRIAYRWYMWAADTVREPVLILNGVVVAIYPNTSGFENWRMHMGVGNAYTDVQPGRGPMLAYARNVVVLHGISKADVLTLLTKPVN